MALKKEWKIPTGKDTCNTCSKKFVEQDRVTCVLEIQGEFLHRNDLCSECWSKPEKQGLIFSRWTKEFTTKRKSDFDPEELTSIMESLTAHKKDPAQEHKRKGLCYLLALFLVRRKLYKMSDTTIQNGKEFFKLSNKSDKSFEIEVPDITDDEIEAFKNDFARLFEIDMCIQTK